MCILPVVEAIAPQALDCVHIDLGMWPKKARADATAMQPKALKQSLRPCTL